jgi:hypothetical protein
VGSYKTPTEQLTKENKKVKKVIDFKRIYLVGRAGFEPATY